jgi:hypothetical protein
VVTLLFLILMTGGCCLLSQLEVLGSLDAKLLLGFTLLAFQTQDDLSCGLGLLVKHGLGLSSESHLLRVVTALALSKVRSLTGLVLRHLVNSMLLTLAGAVCLALFRNIHHVDFFSIFYTVVNNGAESRGVRNKLLSSRSSDGNAQESEKRIRHIH